MQYVHKNVEEYNACRKFNVIIIFYDMITDMISNKNLS